jgi:purine-binding chemotaxis protein CheW
MENEKRKLNDTGSLSQEIQLVVFDLAAEYYGVDIGDVREIIRMQVITRIPGAPKFVEGVINLRGKVVPVLDLRKRLNRQVKDQTKDSRIVVVHIEGNDVGVIVDGVTEVLRVPLSSIEPPSHMITDAESDYLRGIAKLETKLIILLDLNKALANIGSGLRAMTASAEAEAAVNTAAVPTEMPKAPAVHANGNGRRKEKAST